jgi:hypothetical protein
MSLLPDCLEVQLLFLGRQQGSISLMKLAISRAGSNLSAINENWGFMQTGDYFLSE